MTRRALPLDRLGSGARGLTAAQVEESRRRYGSNDVLGVQRRSPWVALLDAARDPMVWFLFATSAVYAVLGQRLEAVILFLAIIPVLGLDAFLHRRARASTEGLAPSLAGTALALRDGHLVDVPGIDLVVGDEVEVRGGVSVPADGVFVEVDALQIEEAALTGESIPVRKRVLEHPPTDGAPLVEDDRWGFAGTRVLTGRGRLRITHVGRETLYGEIVRSALQDRAERTPVQRAIDRLLGVLIAGAALACIAVAVVRWRAGYGWLDALVSAATLAVAALPEEVPLVFTVFLGVGVYRLARHHVLVRRAVVVENIGRVTTIVTDKTGTLTEGRLSVTGVVSAGDRRERPLLVAHAAGDASSGDPLDVALARATDDAGHAPPEIVAQFPFTEERRRHVTIVREADGVHRAMMKGAAETVLDRCTLSAPEREAWTERASAAAAEGARVIACASRVVDATRDEPPGGYTFEGLVIFADPVRDGVREALAECRALGLRAIVVTGDQPATAAAVARALGLDARVRLAADIEALPDDARAAALAETDVVARALPAHKSAIVRALHAAGEIVAVTGDGANDVPALREADVSVAMGERGTRSAREVSSIVLLDDSFASIVRAIQDGRQLFADMRRSYQFLILAHTPLVLTAALIPLAGFPVLYLPLHIVWLELLIHPTSLLAFRDTARDARVVPPPEIITRREWFEIALASAFGVAAVLVSYRHGLHDVGLVPVARALALVTLTFEWALWIAYLSAGRGRVARIMIAACILPTVAFVQIPACAALLHMAPLRLHEWALAMGGAAVAVGVPALLARWVRGRRAVV